jgi:hypothetical protein
MSKERRVMRKPPGGNGTRYSLQRLKKLGFVAVRFRIKDRVRIVTESADKGRTGTVTGIFYLDGRSKKSPETVEGYAVQFDDRRIDLFFVGDLETE